MPSLSFGFKGKTLLARQAAASHAAELVTRISSATRQAIRTLIVRGISQGIPPRELAGEIRQLIGLTSPQQAAARAYKASLRRMGHSPQRVEALMETYVARKLRERALMIARTETMSALNQGKMLAARDAVDDGRLEQPEKTWVATPGLSTCCDACRKMDGKTIALDKMFSTPLGKVQAPPLHPHCRCTIAVTEGN